jgi:hypothetical protein
MRERTFVFTPFGVVSSSHEQRCCGVRTYAQLGYQVGRGGGHEPLELSIKTSDLLSQLLVAVGEFTQCVPGRLDHRVGLVTLELRGSGDQLGGASPRSCCRNSSGAVVTSAVSWFAVMVRLRTAERLADAARGSFPPARHPFGDRPGAAGLHRSSSSLGIDRVGFAVAAGLAVRPSTSTTIRSSAASQRVSPAP